MTNNNHILVHIKILFILLFLPFALHGNESLDSAQINLLKNIVSRYSIPYLGNKNSTNEIYFITSLASCNTCSVQLKELEKLVKNNNDIIVYVLHTTEYSLKSKFAPLGYNDIAKVNYAIWNINPSQYFDALRYISEITANTKIKDFDIFEELRNMPKPAFSKQSETKQLNVDKIKLYSYSSRSDELISKTTEVYKDINISSLPAIIINNYIYSEPMFAEDILQKIKSK